MTVLPGEGAVEGNMLYRKAWLYHALQSAKTGNYKKALSQIDKAREWPENLGAGKPYDEDIDSRAEDCLAAFCYHKLNDSVKASPFAARERLINERLKAQPEEEMYRIIKQIN
jgi:hypothetical protein